MAANHRVLTQTQATQVLGDGTTLPIMDVTIETIPSRIVAGYYMPLQLWGDSLGNDLLDNYAEALERTRNLPNVADLIVYEDVTLGGLLAHFATVYVTSTSGNSSGFLDERVDRLYGADIDSDIAALHAKLDATEAGG